MKTSFRIISIILLVICIAASAVSPVHASPQFADRNPAAEDYLLNALRTDGFVDLSVFPEGERNISGNTLVTALKDPQVQEKSFIYISNFTVVDDVYANDLNIPANLQFFSAEFNGVLDFSSSILQSVWIGDSKFQGMVNFGMATFNGAVIINNNTFADLSFLRVSCNESVDLRGNIINGGLNFYGTKVSGELLLDDTQILGTEPLPGTSFPVEFWTTTVEGVASFVNTRFAGDAYFFQSNFYRLEMFGAAFNRSISFAGTNVERSADFANASFGQADFKDFFVENTANFGGVTFNGETTFENATIGRDANFSGASFRGRANFNFMTVGRFFDFVNTTFNDEFSFYYTSVAWPYFENVTFNGPVTFEGMQASEDLEFVNTSYNFNAAPFPLTAAEVAGAVKFIDFTAPAGLLLSHSHFESLSVDTRDNPKIAFIDISQTDIDNAVTIENVDVQGFIAEGATIGKTTSLRNTSISTKLDMRNASIGFLKVDDQPKWPTDPAAFNLRGMTYTDIDIGDQGLTDETIQSLLRLINQSAYSPQAYNSLAQFLNDKGHPDWAAEVELAQNRRERDEILTPLSGAWFWSWFLDIFAGYGKRPIFAFFWSGLVILMGALVFRRKENMLPVEQDDAQVEYNPLWYSFALFIPYVDLGISSKWEPKSERKWARNYKYVHMILGWVLAPIALLAFSGFIG